MSTGRNVFSNKFLPLFHNVVVLAGCLWIADAVACFVNAIANDQLAACVVAYQVAFAGWRVFDLSYFVWFHFISFVLCFKYTILIGVCQVVSLTIYDFYQSFFPVPQSLYVVHHTIFIVLSEFVFPFDNLLFNVAVDFEQF